ncbi:hypothetical protein ACOME3_000556 [Neoechinorhynchus agilis]
MPPESTISTTAAAAGTEDKPRYRSAIGPRSSSTSTRLRGIINPTSSTISTFSTSFVMPPPSATSTASLVRSTRERERRELVELNDRFANYVERVRFLEAQNKKLKMEAEGLRKQLDSNGAGSGLSRLREMYETELKEARALVDETARQKNDVELRLRKIEDEGADLRDQLESLRLVRSGERKSIDSLSRQVADNEAELGLLHRRIKDTDDEYRRQKAENQKLTAQIQSVMNELYQETALKLELQNEKQSLEEELSFLKQIHAQEIEEINSINQSADQGLDPSLFFKHELANAIRDIRDEYETLNQQQKQELEGWYRLKVTEAVQEMQARRPTESPISRLRDEEELRQLREQVTNSRKDAGQLRTKNKDLLARVSDLESVVNQERRQGQRDRDERDREIMDLRAKFEQVLAEYDDLVSSKTTLDTEIAVYRKLLESEEHRNRSPFEIDRQPSSPPPPPPPPQPTEMYPSQESIDGAFESVVEASVERSEDHQKPPKEPVTSVASSSSEERIQDEDEDKRQRKVHFDSNVQLHGSEESIGSFVTNEQSVKEEESKSESTSDQKEDVSELVNIVKDFGLFSQEKDTTQQIVNQQILYNVTVAQKKVSLVVRQARNLNLPRAGALWGLYVRCIVPRNNRKPIRQKSHSVDASEDPIWNTLFEFTYDPVVNSTVVFDGHCV